MPRTYGLCAVLVPQVPNVIVFVMSVKKSRSDIRRDKFPLSYLLVLNTLRKMYKTEFCLNNHTNGRNTKNDNYGKILWTGSSFFTTPEDVPDCSNYRVLIFHNSIGAHSVWRDSILTFTYLANSALYIDTFSVIRNGNTIRLTNNTRYCAGTISTSDIPITKIIGII